MSLTIAIIGRPNVGKSTLFNRFVQQKIALVDDRPGVTRDRRVHSGRLQDLTFNVIDTPGLEEGEEASLVGRMRAQTKAAIEEADIVLFVIDAKTGILASDIEFSSLIRKSGKPIILVANKSESKKSDAGYYDAWKLGLGDPCPISAEHGLGLSDLRDAIVSFLPASKPEEKASNEAKISEQPSYPFLEKPYDVEKFYDEEDGLNHEEGFLTEGVLSSAKPLRIAIVGRPNVGKSTFINSLLGEDRLLTGPEAGITRDSISVEWAWKGQAIKLFDTAGLRRKARVEEKLEKLSVGETLRAIRFAEIVVIMLDATMAFEKQDLQIADLVIREGRAPILAFNKWDLIEDKQKTLQELHRKCETLLPQIRGVRAVPVSAEQCYGFDNLMQNIALVYRTWNKRVSTAQLNRWIETIVTHHPPPAVSGRRLKIKYITQVKTRPPTFMLSCSQPQAMPKSYVRYLANALRVSFDMGGVPLRLILNGSDNPFAGRRKKNN